MNREVGAALASSLPGLRVGMGSQGKQAAPYEGIGAGVCGLGG